MADVATPRTDAAAIWEAAIDGVRPERLVAARLAVVDGEVLLSADRSSRRCGSTTPGGSSSSGPARQSPDWRPASRRCSAPTGCAATRWPAS